MLQETIGIKEGWYTYENKLVCLCATEVDENPMLYNGSFPAEEPNIFIVEKENV